MVLSSWLLTPFGVVLDIFAFRLDQPTNLKNLWTPVLGVVVALIGLGAILLGRYLRRQGKRLISAITSLAAVLAAPPFVLYLRSFADDPRLGSVRLHWRERLLYRGKDFGSLQIRRTEEEQLRVAAAPFGRMVAVGRPDERLPEIGARRLYLPHADWQESVLRLMAEAGRTGLVLMTAGLSEGLGWEFAQAVRTVPPERLVVMVALNPREYERFRQGVGQVFPRPLPPYPPGRTLLRYQARIRGAIYFDAGWTPHFVRFDALGARGNGQRVIESAFVYNLRPVYDRLRVRWPGIAWLPPRIGLTRRQAPILAILLAVLVFMVAELIILLANVPSGFVLPLVIFVVVSLAGFAVYARS
jgi:hypothetical protein